MAKGIRIKGLDTLLKKVRGLEDVLQDDVDIIVREGANDMNNQAVRNIQANKMTDTGFLSGSQNMIPEGERTYRVVNTASYAAFQEFGTGAQVRVPAGWEAIAAAFRGPYPGTWEAFLESLGAWMARHGMDHDPDDVQYMAAYILTNGLKPQPFLIPAFNQYSPIIVADVESAIKDAIR